MQSVANAMVGIVSYWPGQQRGVQVSRPAEEHYGTRTRSLSGPVRNKVRADAELLSWAHLTRRQVAAEIGALPQVTCPSW